MRIDKITSAEFGSRVKKDPLLILPLGATEAHGIHLPLGTDTFQSEYIADGISKRKDNVLVAPVLPYGNHSSLKNIPGTVNITFDSLRSFVTDILRSFIGHGISRILVLSGHAGMSHTTAVTEACRTVVSEHDVKLMFLTDHSIAASEYACKGDGHGGLIETARMLAIDPCSVGKERPAGRFIDAKGMVLKDASPCMPDGIVGDTGGASSELGTEMNNFIISKIIGMMEDEMI
jgi:creatinine amidohydrolase